MDSAQYGFVPVVCYTASVMRQRELYRETAPPAELAPWIEAFWECEGASEQTSRILPDTCSDLIFERSSHFDGVRFVGTMTKHRWLRSSGPRKILGVRLKPGAAYALLGLELEPAVDASIPLVLEGIRMPEAADIFSGRQEIVADLLECRARLDSSRSRTMRIAQLCAKATSMPISALAESVGMTRQQLRRIIVRATGVAPKQLSRVGRIRRLVNVVPSPLTSQAQLAVQLGFYDQPHMISECQMLLGQPPSELLFR